MRKRITLGLILAVLLILTGVLVNTIVVPRTLAGPPQTLAIDMNAGRDTPFSNNKSIRGTIVSLRDLQSGSKTLVDCMNDFVPDPFYPSTEASEADTPNLVLLQLAVTVPTTLPFVSGPSDDSGWIYNFADNQTGLNDDADPGHGGTSAGGGAGAGSGAPNGSSGDKKESTKSPTTEKGQPDKSAYGYAVGLPPSLALNGNLYHLFAFNYGPPNTTPPNPSGTNDGRVAWLGDSSHPIASGIVFQDSGDPNSGQGNGPQGSRGNGDHHDGGVRPQTFQATTFSLTDDPPPPPLTQTPEPAAWSILGLGLAGLVVYKHVKPNRD